MFPDLNTVEALVAFGLGCASGYGFATRVVVKALISSQVNPLKEKLKAMEQQVKDLTARLDAEEAFNRRIQETIFGLDGDDAELEGTRIS